MPQSKTSSLSITSLGLGILGVTCCGLFTGVLAVICGHMAYVKINRSGGQLKGQGLAIAGFTLGYLSLFTTVILAALALPAFTGALERGQLTQKLSNARQIHLAVASMALDGETLEDKSLGYPADAGITTVKQLKSLLVEKGYLSAEDAEALGFESFLFGNVSESDPPETIFLRTAAEPPRRSFLVFRLGGDGSLLRSKNPEQGDNPPREPAYLKP